MSEIREWLETGQDYAQGVALYETHGSSRVVLNCLRYGETAFTRQKLRAELERLAGVAPGASAAVLGPQRPAVPATPIATQTVPALPKTVPPPDVPGRRTWYATRSHLHAQLELVATADERRELAARILELSADITASYQAAPEPAEAPHLVLPDDAGELRRLLANLRSQRSKLKNRPDRAGDLARVEALIPLLEMKLKTRDGDQPELHPRH